VSKQIQWLKNIVQNAQTNNEAAIELLREISAEAVKEAAAHDLVTIGHCLVAIGEQASRTEANRN
jgi:hypothetical protein